MRAGSLACSGSSWSTCAATAAHRAHVPQHVRRRCSCSARWAACSTRCRNRSRSAASRASSCATRSRSCFRCRAYRERIAALPGREARVHPEVVRRPDPVDPRDFYAQFAVDDDFFPMYAKDMAIIAVLAPAGRRGGAAGPRPEAGGLLHERTACVVGEKLMTKKGWKLGQTIPLDGTIFRGTWPFVIRGVYHATNRGFGDETLFFHYKYLDQKGMDGAAMVGIYVLDCRSPARARRRIARRSTRCSRTRRPRPTPRASRRSRPASSACTATCRSCCDDRPRDRVQRSW